MESHFRTVLKTVSWRIIATLITFSIAMLFTQNVELSAGIGAADMLMKLAAYYGHERAWIKVNFGKPKVANY